MTETAKSLSQQNRKQLVALLVGIIILFFVCLLPFRLMALWETFFPNDSVLQVGAESYLNIIYFCRLLVYVNSAGNPIIYNLVSTKFRRAFQKVLRLYCCCCRKRLVLNRQAISVTSSHGTRLTTMSHYTAIRQEQQDTCRRVQDTCRTAHAV
ncbi:unnamed protein product [Candidula unifasciata]|uniref:G-protein coupled receptors family 1 profile domain-containing protein n=1 Tax=Candidula unifasciata TaxID=100452 RepID=A0A8S3ZDC1_9EUPU|nr:unnamed protein product [Candidula unifasciata]